MIYLLMKWLHLMSLISWMAGVLYLIRLYVYHKNYSSENHPMLLVMERRLFRFITRPAMALTWVSGLVMASMNHTIASQSWFMIKLTCVLVLSFVTELAGGMNKKLASGQDPHDILPSSRKLRFFNEVPTLLMAIILALVLFRPF